MKKFVIAAALLSLPTLTFAGGAGNPDLLNYTQNKTTVRSTDFITNFDPSRSAEARQPQIGAIGEEVNTEIIESGAIQTETVNIQETVTISPRRRISTEAGSQVVVPASRFDQTSAELAANRQDAARAKLLKYRMLNR